MDDRSEITCRMLVVSLKEATARRAQVEQSLAELDIPWSFLDASRVDTPSTLAYDEERSKQRFGRSLTPGEIGCFKSHIQALEEFDRAPELDWLVVMEDDVWFDTAFSLCDLVGQIRSTGVGYIKLYARHWKPGIVVGTYGERQVVRMKTDTYGTQCYVISRQAARRFMDTVQSICRPIDDEMGRFWENGLEIYTIFPFPACERAVSSTLNVQRNHLISEKKDDLKFMAVRCWHRLNDFVRKRVYLRLNQATKFDTRGHAVKESLRSAQGQSN